MSVNRLCFVSFRAKNFEAAVRFYRDAMGVALKPGDEYVHEEYSWKNPYLHFAIFPASVPYGPQGRPSLAFAVDDLDAAHERAVASGAGVVHGPKEFPWGRAAEYVDPEGNTVQLVELRSS